MKRHLGQGDKDTRVVSVPFWLASIEHCADSLVPRIMQLDSLYLTFLSAQQINIKITHFFP